MKIIPILKAELSGDIFAMTQHQQSQQSLDQKKVAILVADGFEQVELTNPKQVLEQAGAQTYIVSPNKDSV
jgi:hypothetical protein